MEFNILAFLFEGSEKVPVLVFLVVALTYLSGEFGLKGNLQRSFALVLGFGMGLGIKIASGGFPGDFAGWFWSVVYALVVAALGPLLYNQAKDLVGKVLAEFVLK